MRREEALEILREHRQELEDFGVGSISLFGSVARNEAGPESDVDLLVDFDRETDLFEFVRLRMYLEEICGRKVDLVTRSALKRQMREQVLGEAIRAA